MALNYQALKVHAFPLSLTFYRNCIWGFKRDSIPFAEGYGEAEPPRKQIETQSLPEKNTHRLECVFFNIERLGESYIKANFKIKSTANPKRSG